MHLAVLIALVAVARFVLPAPVPRVSATPVPTQSPVAAVSSPRNGPGLHPEGTVDASLGASDSGVPYPRRVHGVRPKSREALDSKKNGPLLPKEVRDRIVEGFDLGSTDAIFFEQLELSIAGRAFGFARAGATNMVDPDGKLNQARVDDFHNFLDEFLRALGQIESGDMPANDHYGNGAKRAAKVLEKAMSQEALRDTAKRLKKDLAALKRLANDTPGLEDVELDRRNKATPPEFAAHTLRVITRIEVITGHCGVGPVFKPALDEAQPLRDNLLRLAQASNGLLGTDGNPTPEQVKAFEGWLKQAIDNAKNLGRNAPAWKNRNLGSRDKLVVNALQNLMKDFRAMKASLAVR